ncbi:MAG: hypothetical protein LUH15_05820 [Tannerellaceae bacterium]|nr:hypothetical protein [Tannerellaceae bacterium]
MIGNDSVLICDLSKVKQSHVLPVELIAKDIEILLLDQDNEDALIATNLAMPYLSENYIAVTDGSHSPLKLFDKEGIFLRHIGGIG